MARWLLIATLVIACEPKQPLQPSFFTAKRDPNGPRTCKETVDCYLACQPLVEECMLRCDQRSSAGDVERARAVANCAAIAGCTDRECEEQRCARERQTCITPVQAPAPSPMRPPPAMQPQPMHPQPTQPPPSRPAEPMPPGPVSPR